MFVSTQNMIGTPVPVLFKFMISIILSINVVLEILPVQKSSDLTSLIIHGFTLHTHFFMLSLLVQNFVSLLQWKI